jgi:hypothetical protein
MTYEIIYASSATGALPETELAKILSVARATNAARGVSGMLLYEAGSFLQILEGEQAAVEQLYEHISKDKRHGQVVVLHRGEIAAPVFAEWSMGLLAMSDAVRAMPGISEFLRTGVVGLKTEKTLVSRVLTGFRDGQYRRALKAA